MLQQLWIAIACVLVASMQIGFLFLEAGFVRSKNSINVSLKNIADFAVAVLIFNLLGAAIMFGPGSGFVGFDPNLIGHTANSEVVLFLMLQALFCGTTATIVSGAVAERIRFFSYLALTLPLALIVYPIIGHWVWASSLPGGTAVGWLDGIGFMDAAGSSVVHLTGGAAALAILLVAGARSGRFNEDESDQRTVHGHSPILAGGGALILVVGWLGFNSGGLEPGSIEFSRAISNTMYAAAAGCLVAGITGHLRDGYLRADRMINGVLIGLVTITASAPYATVGATIIAAGIVAAASVFVADWLEREHHVDDAVYAVTVHGFGGAMGTLAVPFVIVSGTSELGFFHHLGVQALGLICIGGFAFVMMKLAATWMHRRGLLRVSHEDELKGLNLAEHRAVMGHASLLETLTEISKGDADLATRVDVDPFEDGGDLAAALNGFLDKVETAETAAAGKLLARQNELALLADRERQRADDTEQTLQRFQFEFSALVESLKSQSAKLADGSESLAEHSQESGDLVTHASAQAEATVVMAEQMSEGAAMLAATLEQVGQKVLQAGHATLRADEASQSGEQIASTLEDSTRQIGKLVALIESISAQTDLLAVNAKIEAARAGEAGLGFSVVSDEVGQLAKKTKAASNEISDIVESLVGLIGHSVAQFRAIGENVEVMRRVAEEAEASTEQQRDTGAALTELIAESRAKTLDSGAAVSQVSDNFVRAGATIQSIGGSARELDTLARKIDQRFQALRKSLAAHSVEPAE